MVGAMMTSRKAVRPDVNDDLQEASTDEKSGTSAEGDAAPTN